MGMIDQIIDFNKTGGTTRMEEYVPTLSRDCHDVPLLAKKRHRHKAMSSFGCIYRHFSVSAFCFCANFATNFRRVVIYIISNLETSSSLENAYSLHFKGTIF